jgi:hypothetical protein
MWPRLWSLQVQVFQHMEEGLHLQDRCGMVLLVEYNSLGDKEVLLAHVSK